MAVRLNVLVLRPTGAGSSSHAHCDDLLGHLLGRPGLDVTLLERLPIPGEESTEMLALESIGGHIACLAWDDPQRVQKDLEQAGRPMTRRPHAGDPDAVDSDESDRDNVETTASQDQSSDARPPGRMYFFDMRQNRDAMSVLESLRALLKTLQVPTFQIGGAPSLASKPDPPQQAQPATPVSRPPVATPAVTPPPAVQPTPEPTSLDASVSDALDRLVDQLDELDI
ncbi:hypothetical protein [Aporhodopirellula aestuarii]|uniref:Uncharacterized protein n=1 Tax=Aporhodopirellula aestuarii TaxID=2950107 RepID=A0ABT0U3W6_9BACT|nr:hypothetical protein [Aporhodopirellula aestuarii]MCM2371615.1 hypothetical protein [Aporhodopirellula aestuarii]